jgi:hypothetical protein
MREIAYIVLDHQGEVARLRSSAIRPRLSETLY